MFSKLLKKCSQCSYQKMQVDLRLNLYSNIDLKNEPNTRQIFQTFDRPFFVFGRLPATNKLTFVPMSDVSSFAQSSDIISPYELYRRYNLGNTTGLVSIHFLAALNIN